MQRLARAGGLVLALVLGFSSTLWAQAAPANTKKAEPSKGKVRRAPGPKLTKGLRYASLTPNHEQVVFGYRGDIWVAPADGKGPALRLTLHEAQDTLPRVSPDGKLVAFSSMREGNYDLYVVPITGGVPKRVTFHSGYEILCDWSPDGKKLLFVSPRELGSWGPDLFEVGLDGGTPRRITHDGGREGAYTPDGKHVVYARGFNTLYWDDYEGSANYDLHVVPVAGGPTRKLTDTKGNEHWPMVSKDGKTIWFVAEEKKVANFYAMPFEGGERRQVTKYTGYDVHRPNLATDHRTVVFERGGLLFKTDLEKPAAKPTALPLVIKSDVRHSGVVTRTITSGGDQVDVSRDGRMVAMTVRGDIWIMSAGGGQGRRITSGPANDQWPRFSPDGTKVAYFSNLRGNNDVFVVDLRNGSTRQITTHSANDFFQSWAPDGRRLVFTSDRSGNKDIWLIDLDSGVKTQLTRDRAGDDDPTFSPDGKLIAFDSSRGGSQSIYVMNADGSNVRRVVQDAGFFQVPSFSPDGKMLVYEAYSPTTGRSGGLHVIRTSGGASAQLSRDGQTARWSPVGDYIYFHATRGRQDGIYRVKAPASVEAGQHVPFIGTVQVELRKELGDLFDEAWNALKEGFYDAKMHGVDWNAMRKKYRDMAIDTENKAEFHNVIRQLLAELGASHLGISGGTRTDNGVTPQPKENGQLGLEFRPEPEGSGGRVVVDVLPGGPADRAGIRVGDVVTRIGRAKLTPQTNLDKVTAGLAGGEVLVAFRPRSADGLGEERGVNVKPVSLMGLYQLRYRAWERKCARTVKEKTEGDGGEIGYIHLSQMNGSNLQKFQQTVERWNQQNWKSKKKIRGMVLDVRNNGGGNIHGQLIAILTSKPLAWVQRRGGQRVTQPSLFWDRPVVLLINERSFSDAEVFPHMFRAAGLGKIIGVPTAGGVIGTNDITLSDGSRFRIPRTGFWTMDGKDLEGLGVEPDILVVETSEDRLNGRDPQLMKAIEVILAEAQAAEEAAKPKKAEPKKTPEVEPKAEPAPEPTPEPAPGPDATATKPDLDPLADVRVGEWVRYRMVVPDRSEPAVVKVTVSSVSDGLVEFRNEWEIGSGDLMLPKELPRRGVLESLPQFGKVLGVARVEGKVGEATVPLVVAELEWADGSHIRLTLTEAVPAYGLLRVEMNEMVLLEATEWGVPADEATPTVAPEEAPVPAEEPTPAPEKPEAPAHPVRDAEVGEWMKVRREGPGGRSLEIVVAVTEVTDTEVVLSQTVRLEGREIAGPEIRRPRSERLEPPEGFTLVGYGEESITAADQEFTCAVMTATDPSGTEWKWFVHDEIPVNGYVRVMRDGKVLQEIVEWGWE
jgi:tricorn protease